MLAVILVNYNGSDDTVECISSLTKCSYQDFYIIVVDNGSTDNSVDKLIEAGKTYSFKLLCAGANAGFSAGNNIGIRYALRENAEYILLLNNDTIVSPDFFQPLLHEFSVNPDCGAATGKIMYEQSRNRIWYAGGLLDPRTARTEHFHYGETESTEEEKTRKVTFASGCCLCLSAKTVKKNGLLNEDYFLYEEDAEYCVRLIKNGFDIVYVPASIIYHKISASTGVSSPLSEYYRVRNKYHLIRMHFRGINKITAYVYCTMQFFFRCIKHELRLKSYISGTLAFLHHEIGRGKYGHEAVSIGGKS